MKNARLAAGSWQPAADHGGAPKPSRLRALRVGEPDAEGQKLLHPPGRGPVLAAVSSSCGYTLAGRGSFLPETIRVIGDPRLHQPHAVLRGGADAHAAGAVGVHRPRQVQGAAAGHRGGRGAEGRDHLDLDSPLQLQPGPAGHAATSPPLSCRCSSSRPTARRCSGRTPTRCSGRSTTSRAAAPACSTPPPSSASPRTRRSAWPPTSRAVVVSAILEAF